MDTGYNRQLPEDETNQNTSKPSEEDVKQQRRTIIGIAITIIVILAILIVSLAFLFSPNTTPVTVVRIRDVFIIVMALESVFVGLVLVILMIQLARLINLLQNEVKPILDSTNETISNLRGTTEFLSSNLAEPIIKLNEYLAGLQKITEIFGFKRRK
jgi:predicted PurR-regulated permease PerM